jgi:predicted hotdog family 3-hydroxylacyl-ACP dehydratase
MIDIDIERLIPHRNRMKLIDKIIKSDDEKAITESIVTENWPLFKETYVNSIIIIELVAQTASVCIGYKELKKKDGKLGGKGWLVGIKTASFFLDQIDLNARLTTCSRINFNFDNYTQIFGTVKIGSKLIGEVNLQVLRSESGSVLKSN